MRIFNRKTNERLQLLGFVGDQHLVQIKAICANENGDLEVFRIQEVTAKHPTAREDNNETNSQSPSDGQDNGSGQAVQAKPTGGNASIQHAGKEAPGT